MTLRDISINENFGALRRVLSRERRRRQPPKVSGSLAAPQPKGASRGGGLQTNPHMPVARRPPAAVLPGRLPRKLTLPPEYVPASN
jgi:hypothetical protein